MEVEINEKQRVPGFVDIGIDIIFKYGIKVMNVHVET